MHKNRMRKKRIMKYFSYGERHEIDCMWDVRVLRTERDREGRRYHLEIIRDYFDSNPHHPSQVGKRFKAYKSYYREAIEKEGWPGSTINSWRLV